MSDLRNACEGALSHPFFAASPQWAQQVVRNYLAGNPSDADDHLVNRAIATVVTTHAGRYTHAFLDSVVGRGRYILRTVAIDELEDPDVEASVELALEDPALSFATCDEENVTLLWLHDHPGWMEWTSQLGVNIVPSTKVPKRCKIFTRLAFLHGLFADGEVNIGYIDDPTEFSEYSITQFTDQEDPQAYVERFIDGANVVSRELIEKLAENGLISWNEIARDQAGKAYSANRTIGTEINPAIDPAETRGRIGRSVDHIKSVSIRVLSRNGQIKGEALVVPRDQIPGGHDVLAFRGNEKKETTFDGIFIIAEPVHSPGEVFTDEQTVSWLGKFLYPASTLIEAMTDEGERLRKTLLDGDYPDFYAKVSEIDDSISRFRRQALTFHGQGLGIGNSIYLLERIISGFHKQLMSKRRWPVPCAIYSHVATDSMLAMAGYLVDPNSDKAEWPKGAITSMTPEGSTWYHEASGRLIYNDLDFARLYDRHGGWDLDDSIKAHWRMIPNPETGELEKKIITVRCPNSYGEYAIMNPVEGAWEPTWEKVDGSKINYLPVGDVKPPQFLEQLDITYKRLTPPPKPDLSEGYSRDFVRRQIETAIMSRGVFGRRANADMVYYETLNDYRREQLDSIEAIIDACTQELSIKALEEINQDTKDILDAVKESGVPVDIELWKRRVGRQPRSDMQYKTGLYTKRMQLHDTLCDMFKAKMMAEAQDAAKNINPLVLELGKQEHKAGRQLVDYFYELVNRPGARDQRYYAETNNALVATLAQFPRVTQYNIVLSMARVCYMVPRANNRFADTALFQTGDGKGDSVFNIYMEALNFYGISDEDWVAHVKCFKCDNPGIVDDSTLYQKILLKRVHFMCDVCSS